MSKPRLILPRRAVLKGIGGVTLALPLLEVMLDSDKALAQSANPPRYIVFFNGQSMGADGDTVDNYYVPNTVGANYDLKQAIAPLGGDTGLGYQSVQQYVSVVSGLKIPTAFENGGVVPAGGRRDDFHVSSLSPLLSGVRSPANTSSAGVTSDQLMVPVISGNTSNPSLVYRVQADWYLSVSAPYGRDMISYKAGASAPVPIPPIVSPQQAFSALFGNFTPSGIDPATAVKLDLAHRERMAVIDLVKGNAQRLVQRLGSADRIRMQQHLDELNDLEKRVAAIPPPQTSTCVKPGDPGPDPTLGGPQGTDSSGNNTYSQNLGYSGEEQRARVFCDLIHMALACDLSRVVSLQITMFQSHMNMYQVTGQATDCHELGHGGVPGGTAAVSKGIAWHVKFYAYLINKLASTPELGGTMLDNSVLVYVNEGGHGFDPGGNKQNSSHSTENMACMIAGKAGGLKPGLHVPAPGMHPANVLLTGMRALGYSQTALGEVSGEIPGLRS